MSISRRRPTPALQTPPLIRLMADNGSRQLGNPSHLALDLARNRLLFVAVLFLIAYGVIAARLVDLTLIAVPEENTRQVAAAAAGPARADVMDRQGAILATSLPTTSACLNARLVIEPDRTIAKVAEVLPDIDKKKILADIKNTKRCVMLRAHLTPTQHHDLNGLGLVGLEFLPSERRVYPAGELTAHVLGYTDTDNQGLAGLEKSIDQRLRRQQASVQLSLDLRVQQVMQQELQAAIDQFSAIGAAGIIMDVTTGEVISLVSLPHFDPNKIKTASPNAMFNRATLGVYELGSVFKIFTAAQGLDSGEIRLSDTFDATHSIQIGGQTIADFHPENRWLNVPEIMIHSSNIGAARMADLIGGARQKTFLKSLGLMEASTVELPEVGRPLVPATWGEVTTMTVAFGHGMAISPMQMVAGVAAIVNGGYPVKATLIKQTEAKEAAPAVIGENTSAKLRAMLRLVVSDGTARQANAPGYLVAGKTGTAEKITGKAYNKDQRIASFVGIFPADKPRYAVFVMIDEPKGTKETYGFATAGWVAAPAVGRIVTAAGPMLGLSPMDEATEKQAEANVLRPLGTLVNSLRQPVEAQAEPALVDDTNDRFASAGPAAAH